MKVAFDAIPLTTPMGGIRRYTEQLFQAWRETFPEDTCELIAPAGRLWWSGRVYLWWSCRLPWLLRRRGFHVFHGTNFEVPYLPVCPSVMTLHDLSPWKPAPWRAASSRVRRRTPWLLRLGLAAMVVTPSHAVRREAMLLFSLPSNRITVVPEAADPRFRPGAGPAHPPYALFVGSAEPRKNAAVALEACRAAGIELVVTGTGPAGARALGGVSDEELVRLYQGASVLLYPSHYEGFGLPLLEAMACGVPVIASRDPALREVAADAALHLDPADPPAWTEALRAVLTQPQPWRERGLRRASEFSWPNTVRAMRDVYQEAICRRAR